MLQYDPYNPPPVLMPSRLHPGLHFLVPAVYRRYVMEQLMEENGCSFSQACSIYDTMPSDVRAGIVEQRFPEELEYVLLA